MGRCRGWREPPDGAWTYLTFPGPEVEKLQRSAVDPGGREGWWTNVQGIDVLLLDASAHLVWQEEPARPGLGHIGVSSLSS